MKGWTRSRGVRESSAMTELVQDSVRPATVHLGLSVAPGYMRSEDSGKSFFIPGKGLGGMTALVVCPKAPKRLYASLSTGKVALSDDLGETWRTTAMRGFPQTDRWLGLVGDPLDAGRIYLTRPGDYCLWRSDDSGETWTRMDRGLKGADGGMTALAVNRRGRKIVQYGVGRAAMIGPGEDLWQAKTFPEGTFVGDPFHPDRFWRLDYQGLWRSDRGGSWIRVSRIRDGMALVCDTHRPGYLAIVQESQGASISDNYGKSWKVLAGTGASMDTVTFAGKNIVSWDHDGLWWRKL